MATTVTKYAADVVFKLLNDNGDTTTRTISFDVDSTRAIDPTVWEAQAASMKQWYTADTVIYDPEASPGLTQNTIIQPNGWEDAFGEDSDLNTVWKTVDVGIVITTRSTTTYPST